MEQKGADSLIGHRDTLSPPAVYARGYGKRSLEVTMIKFHLCRMVAAHRQRQVGGSGVERGGGGGQRPKTRVVFCFSVQQQHRV